MTDEPLAPIAPPAHPVVELSYATPRDEIRPGYLTATAIVSILVGSLSALSSGSSVIRYLTLYMSNPSLPMVSMTGYFSRVAFQSVSLVAAGILLFGGIRLLQNRHIARRLHWLFVAIKLPLALIDSALAMVLLLSVRSMSPFILSILLSSVVFSIIYPAALCVILTRPRAKAYFARTSGRTIPTAT